jgi:hypothetical protein
MIPLSKDNTGKIISEKLSVLENWKKHFNNILNFETQQAKVIPKPLCKIIMRKK